MEENNLGNVVRSSPPHQEPPTKLRVQPTEEPVADNDTVDDHGTTRESCADIESGAKQVEEEVEASTISHEEDGRDEDEGSDQSDGEDGDQEEVNSPELDDDPDERPETCLHADRTIRSVDNEVERHEVHATLPITRLDMGAMVEASKTALFRRYSRMTPLAVKEQERSFHEEAFQENVTHTHHAFCPEPNVYACQNPACVDELRWRDGRIVELQAALDHMMEAMAIQQRDMASQRVFLSRQAEQLTNLSNKLHQDKVAFHVERERFQKTVASSSPPIVPIASKFKPATGKIKSPVKKLIAAATGRRPTLERATSATLKLHSSYASPLTSAGNNGSSSPLRRNPLVCQERSTSLSLLDLHLHVPCNDSVVASTLMIDGAAGMVDLNLNDGFSPPKNTIATTTTTGPVVTTLPDLEIPRRTDRVDSSADLSSEQKRQSIGDRFRSLRWSRS